MTEFSKQNICIEMIIITYVETLEATGKSAMIWNYNKTVKAFKSICTVLKSGRTCNYILDDNKKTTWGY